jgi:hypothetical protein
VLRAVQRQFEPGDAGALGGGAGVGRDRRDGAGQPEVAAGHRADVVAGQPHVDVGVAQVQVGVVVHRLRGGADGLDDGEAGREVPGPDPGLQPADQVGPSVRCLVGDFWSGQFGHAKVKHARVTPRVSPGRFRTLAAKVRLWARK